MDVGYKNFGSVGYVGYVGYVKAEGGDVANCLHALRRLLFNLGRYIGGDRASSVQRSLDFCGDFGGFLQCPS